jgi:hypothetical protein
MPRYSAGVKTGAGSTTLPIISLYSVAATGPKLREVGVFNTTATAVDIKLVRLTSAGTQGAGLVEAKHDPDSAAAQCTAFTTHTANPSLGDDLGYRASLGAAIGSGVIWTFGDQGIRVPLATSNGVGVIIENGTGQACQAYIVWDE